MIEVEGPDKQIIEFEDGTSDAEIEKVMAEIYSAPQAPSADWMQNLKERDYLQQAPLTAQALKATEGIPLVGGWMQDIASAVSPELEAKRKALSEAKRVMSKNGSLIIGYSVNKEKTDQDQINERGYLIRSPYNQINSIENLDNLVNSVGLKMFYSKIIGKNLPAKKLIYGATK